MKKRILSMILALVMLIGLVPEMGISVSAEGTFYDLWVGGVQVTDANKGDLVIAINQAANATVATGSATYDPDTKTLTLNGFSYTGAGRETEDCNAAISTDSINLNVKLVGTNTITCQSDDESVKCHAICVRYVLDPSAGHLTIYGTDKETDKLICTANDGISSVRSITVEDAAVQTNGAPIISSVSNLTITDSIVSADLEAGDITLENSELEISETAYASDDFTITNSTVTGGGFSAFDDASTLTVTGSQVNVTAISACGFIIEGNSNVTAQAILIDRALIVTDSSVHVTGCEIPELGLEGSFGILLIRLDSVVCIDNSTVEVYGDNGAYLYTDDFLTFKPFAPLFIDGEELADPDDYAVTAGSDAENATKKDASADATYASKYVKIVPIQTYDVWVGGEQFTSEKLSIEGDSGTATYDPETNTLTLNNFSHTSEGYEFSQFMGPASIYATLEHLTVNFVGNNTVACSAESGYALYNYGALTITADDTNGSLALTGDGDGIWVSGNLIINGCRVNATGIRSNGTIAITNSFVTANGARHGIAVVHAVEGVTTEMKSDDLTITNSTVVATGGEYALFYDGGHNEEDESSIRGGLIPKLVFDNKFAAVAGSDAESAVMAAADAAATYENKHVRIVSVHDVTYKVDGEVVKTLTVEHGKDAIAPEIPAKTGYTGAWSADGKNITADTEINAVYTINKYTVTYKADGKVVKTVEVEHGKDATAPEIPAKEGYNETAPKWDKDGKNITADTEINAVYTKNQPGEYADVTPDTNVGGGKVAEEIEELKEKVPFTPEEKLQIEHGADVEIWLEIKDISDSVSSEEKAKVEEKLGDADVALYLDIAMFKQVGENEASRLTQLSDKVQITFKLDDSYINTDKDVTRTYSIIHVHDGKAEVITPVFDAATKTLTFETDRFSTYGVVYTDEKITPPAEIPAAGDSFQPAFWIACMTLSIFGMAVLLLDAKRRHAR